MTKETEWEGDLDDDCTLTRYGMLAHVENLDTRIWWFAISNDKEQLYNTADNDTYVKLTTGKMARAAAECVMEYLHRPVELEKLRSK